LSVEKAVLKCFTCPFSFYLCNENID